VDAMVIYQHPLHLEVSLLAGGLLGVFDEGVLETVTCPLVTNNFAG
jgi:hypothetical protein